MKINDNNNSVVFIGNQVFIAVGSLYGGGLIFALLFYLVFKSTVASFINNAFWFLEIFLAIILFIYWLIQGSKNFQIFLTTIISLGSICFLSPLSIKLYANAVGMITPWNKIVATVLCFLLMLIILFMWLKAINSKNKKLNILPSVVLILTLIISMNISNNFRVKNIHSDTDDSKGIVEVTKNSYIYLRPYVQYDITIGLSLESPSFIPIPFNFITSGNTGIVTKKSTDTFLGDEYIEVLIDGKNGFIKAKNIRYIKR